MPKKLLLSLFALALGISLVGCSETKVDEESQKEFEKFIENEFVETMESDYLTSHVFLEDPSKYGVDESKIVVNLGSRLDEESTDQDNKETLETYEKFKEFNRKKLNPENQDTYDIFEYMIEIAKKSTDDKFDYYAPAFQSMTGMHYQLPTLFADYTLRDEQDVKDLIVLIKDVKPYMDSCIAYTKKQEEKGLMMLDLDNIIEYCENLLKNKDNSSILASMLETLDALDLAQSKKDSYKKQITESFNSSFIPAYENIVKAMKELKNGKNNLKGLGAFENGKKYYEVLLQNNIGSDDSVEETRKYIQNKFDEHMRNLQKVVISNPEAAQKLVSNDLPTTKFKDYTAVLDSLKADIKTNFPEVKDLSYTIKEVNKDIASDSGVTAYFNIPAIDGTTKKQLRVNPNSNDVKTIATFNTVAHEGFPGHMYQYGYMYENLDNNFRKTVADSSAYTEGYAVYAGYEAFKYLDVDQNVLEAYKENELVTYCLILLADIGIHYDGWGIDEFKKFMNDYGFALDDAAMQESYDQLWANPAAFMPYYVGYLRITDMKKDAQNKLKEKFNEKEFNQALLKSGNAPFNVVERNIEAYIKENK